MSTLRNGDSVARYRVVSSIGAGGMGEVYKAVDESLGRPVALKILPPSLVTNHDRVSRFVREAKSASSLSHPHIVTIHEIGEAKLPEGEAPSVHFIAMEFIEGRTLTKAIHEDHTDLRALVSCLAQAADALAKAHAAGIIHRDLKPENIMISSDGYAKVLDFGLAKLTEKRPEDAASNTPTVTREGVVMGTVPYMSPEQARGRNVDHRSDIFSFGCILYEAATRRRPFDGDSDVEIMHRIMHDRPESIEQLNPSVPGELRRLIRRCLAKEPEKRFHSMKDLAIELGEIVDEWDELSQKPGSGSGSGPVPLASPKRMTLSLAIAGVVVIIATAAIIFALTRSRGGHSQGDSQRFAAMQIRRVTTAGNVNGGSALTISADGRYVAYAVVEGGQHSLVVHQVATGADIRVVAPSPRLIRGATFTPDGNYLAVIQAAEESNRVGALSLIPLLGGPPQRLVKDLLTQVGYSPDGKRFAFVRGYPSAEMALMVANADGTGERKLGTDTYMGLFAPAWSPDGTSIAISKRIANVKSVLMLVDVATGAPRPVPHKEFSLIRGVAWVPDGTALIMAAAETRGGLAQLWRVDAVDGTTTRITNDLAEYISVGITSDGRTLAAMQRQRTSNLWSVPRRGGTPTQLTGGSGLVVEEVVAFNDHLIFTAVDPSGRHVWNSRLDGSEARPIVRDAWRVATSADGRVILFDSLPRGIAEPHLFMADADGGGVRQVSREQIHPWTETHALSPDGTTFVYRRAGGEMELMRASVAGGQPVVFARDFQIKALFSPDGKSVIGAFPVPEGNEMRSYPLAGGPYEVLPFKEENTHNLAWADGGKALSYLWNEDPANVWMKKLDGSAPVKVTDFKDGIINAHAWSPDGKTLYLARGERNTDVVLITDFN